MRTLCEQLCSHISTESADCRNKLWDHQAGESRPDGPIYQFYDGRLSAFKEMYMKVLELEIAISKHNSGKKEGPHETSH